MEGGRQSNLAEDRVKGLYGKQYSRGYRRSDDVSVTTGNHARMRAILQSVSGSFRHQITVLDIACGTGRYFYCLKNTALLVGIDLSPFMIEEAGNPVRKDEISAEKIRLICGSVNSMPFADNSFDLVFSLGALGEHIPFNVAVCDKIYRSMKKEGTFLFTIVDIGSKRPLERLKRTIQKYMVPILPKALRRSIESKVMCLYLKRGEMKGILERSCFADYSIERFVSTAARWKGAHFLCIAHKSV